MRFDVLGTVREVDLDAFIVAGYTGRDREAVLHHIHELEEIGVPPPPYVPFYWRFPPWIASTSSQVIVSGTNTSGEAEVCLVVDGDDILVTVGSDHTDRSAEAIDIAMSKAICPKAMSPQAWPASDVGDRWGELVLRSWIYEDGQEILYQEGVCANLVSPPELLAGIPFKRPARFAMLTGTVPAIGGVRPSHRFRAELHDPSRNRSITMAYDVIALNAPEQEDGV